MRCRFIVLAVLTALLAGCFVEAAAWARDARLPVREAFQARPGRQPPPGRVAFFGVVTSKADHGLEIVRVVSGSAAHRAGLRAGDVIRALDDRALSDPADLQAVLDASAPGDSLRVSIVRDDTLMDREVELGGRRRAERLFRGGTFRLAVVPLRFADDAEAESVDPARLHDFFFDDTGRVGAGASLRDYFAAQSFGGLEVDGRVLAPLRLTQQRARYASRAMGAASGTAFREAARLLSERPDALGLRDVDGIVFLYDGAVETVPGRAFWPHRAVISVGGRRLPYYVHSTETVSRGEIGEHCHEFGHLLGLSDSYGFAHLTGSGDFCVMAIGHRGGAPHGAAVPFSMCASCRSRLGWLDVVTVDPAIPQRLRLRPLGDGGSSVVAIPVDRTTSEYLLLEVRAARGFDAALPSTGLLVWRVGGLPTPGQGAYGQTIDLVEAHGIDTVDASLVRTGEIAFPTQRARDLTPDTIPSSRSGRPGTYPVHLTNMVRESDGSVLVTIGEARIVRQTPPSLTGLDVPTEGRFARIDPITGREFVFDVESTGPAETDGRTPSRR